MKQQQQQQVHEQQLMNYCPPDSLSSNRNSSKAESESDAEESQSKLKPESRPEPRTCLKAIIASEKLVFVLFFWLVSVNVIHGCRYLSWLHYINTYLKA